VASQLINLLIPEIKKWHKRLFPPFLELVTIQAQDVKFVNGNHCFCRTARKENTESLAGVHSSYVCYVIDEASGIDPRIFEVIDKIKGEPSQEFEKMFPAKQPSRVVITMQDGSQYEEYLEYPKGDPREPMTLEDLENKFNSLSTAVLSAERQAEIKDLIFNCETVSAREFMSKLVV
jgi:hypothetical protein